ncbi:hypothetical protein DRN34_05835 [Thermococci archaeon]|nr:MAG: hypothetical protein DRN34_05835 [Thermococci archaeon]
MFNNLLQGIICEKCGAGELFFDRGSTHAHYAQPNSFRVEEIEAAADGIINSYLVFHCSSCAEVTRYTFKEIEKRMRKEITENIIHSIVRGEILPTVNAIDKNFIYCDRCSGFSGNGACPKSIYDKCELKRLPHGLH